MTKRNDPKGSERLNPSSFSLSDFKKWMESQQKESPKKNLVGLTVESKIGLRKLVARMESDDGDIEEMAKEFKKDGGVISEVDAQKLMIDVDSGSFVIHRMYVKRCD